MNRQKRIQLVIGAGLLVTMPGCASIVSGRHADVTFYSSVPDTHVVVRNQRGEEVASAFTPSTIALRRKDRLIFPAKYFATFESPGYQSVEVPVGCKVNPWVWGNAPFLYAGIVGLAVDNVTGAAWSPRQSTIYQELSPIYTAQTDSPATPSGPVLSNASAAPTDVPNPSSSPPDAGVRAASAVY